MKKISVIIPVHDAEAYIEQCVYSLIAQTYEDWEALLVDDGSADNSLEICEALSRTDSRIRIFHQDNKGASAARNCGLDHAEGVYVFFLDSDDAIHPLLFEEMIRQTEEHQAEMAFCDVARVDDQQMNAALAKASAQDEHPRWQIGDGEVSERWFHIDHAAVLCGISGMLSRKLIGALRFDETLSFGEDAIFMHALFRKRVTTAFSPARWYYYRTNPRSLCNQVENLIGDVYTEKTYRIRDDEYQNGNKRYALAREVELTCQLRQRYERCKKLGSDEQCRQIKATALRERDHLLFQFVDPLHKSLFNLCFKCYPLYVPISWVAGVVWTIREKDGEA